MAGLNRAAFRHQDVPDAKRGQPDFDLRDYAGARGLEFLDHGTPAGFRAALPGRAELQHNVMRGVLPGGEYGILANEGLEIGFSVDSLDWPGTFYGMRVLARANLTKWQWLRFFVPVVGELTTPSAEATVRLPCTVAGIRVGETAAVQPCLRIDTRRGAPPYTFRDRVTLDQAGLRGWSAWGDPAPDPEVLAHVLADPVCELLRACPTEDGLFQVIVWFGTLLVRRAGYLRSADELDELARAASLIARRLREACAPRAVRASFADPLPPVVWRRGQPPMAYGLLEAWRGWAQEMAARLELTIEDPLAYHQAFPSIPVPGIAHVVLRGRIPDVGEGRLVVHREPDGLRPAVVVADPTGREPTPPGGVVDRDQGVRIETAGGLCAVWSINSYWGNAMAGDIDAFCAAAGRALGRWLRKTEAQHVGLSPGH